MIIIGITGTIGAGKGTVAEYLVKKRKFKHLSVRDYLVKNLKKRHRAINRQNMVDLANELRFDKGPSFLADELFKKAFKLKKNCVIESIRTPAEAESLRNSAKFFLLAVDAKPRLRFERIKKRGGVTDKVNYREFTKGEKLEMFSKDPAKQNIRKCIVMADYKIINDSDIPELEKNIDAILKEISGKDKANSFKRLSWDDYFMEIANAISKRATCDRGRSGCVIAKDKQVLATGYVGSPMGFPHCDDVGHDLRKTLNEDGTISNHCVRTVHAEQNAICQAAKRGISIEGATVYCRMTPCRVCAMLLINSGVKKIYAERKYHAGLESEKMFKKAKVKLIYKFNEVQKYK